MAELRYVVGDATDPQGPGPKVIVHCCNDIGAWGAGFVMALSKKWPEPEKAYLYLRPNYKLGSVQYVQVSRSITVANLIGQHGVAARTLTGRTRPVRYDAIHDGLMDLWWRYASCSVHMPRMGAGLAGGSWGIIEAIVQEVLVDQGGMDVTVYDLP